MVESSFRIEAPGFYDMPPALYHSDPAPCPSLSASLGAFIVTGTPRHAFWHSERLNPLFEPDDDPKMDLGSVAHRVMLSAGRELVVLDYKDWRTQEARRRRDEALVEGKLPCLPATLEKATAIVEAGRKQLFDDHDNFDAFTNGFAEQAAFAELDGGGGCVWARALLDWRMETRPAIYDYKTTGVFGGPDQWIRSVVDAGRDIQAVLHRRIVAAILDLPRQHVVFRYVIQETNAPYLLYVVEFHPELMAWSDQRLDYALDAWAWALETGQWHGFAPRTHFPKVPGFAEHQWAERIMAEDMLRRVYAREGASA